MINVTLFAAGQKPAELRYIYHRYAASDFQSPMTEITSRGILASRVKEVPLNEKRVCHNL